MQDPVEGGGGVLSAVAIGRERGRRAWPSLALALASAEKSLGKKEGKND